MARFAGDGLTCVRGERLVLDGIGFAIEDGGALLLTGPNGSGKSTLLRLMAGLLKPLDGHITWNGTDVGDDIGAHHARIAYVGHADAVKPALSTAENVTFWGEIAAPGGCSAGDAMRALGISHLAGLPARYLSAGQRRRVSLCRVLTSGAKLWLLDEPTTALDAETSVRLAEMIARHRSAGGMVCASTHSDLGLADAAFLQLSGAS